MTTYIGHRRVDITIKGDEPTQPEQEFIMAIQMFMEAVLANEDCVKARDKIAKLCVDMDWYRKYINGSKS